MATTKKATTKKATPAKAAAPAVEVKPLTHGQILEALAEDTAKLRNSATEAAINFKEKEVELRGFYGEDPKRKTRIYCAYCTVQAKDDYFWTWVFRESHAGNGQWHSAFFHRSKTVEGAEHEAKRRMTAFYNMKEGTWSTFKTTAKQ